jgi:predicted PurR-regulated permease PerM
MADIVDLPPPSDIAPGPAGAPTDNAPDRAASVAPRLWTVFLGGLFALAVLAACYAAADIVLPIVLAFVLSAVFRPVMRLLRGLGLPRPIAALVIVLALVGLFAAVGLLLSAPIAERIATLPQTLTRIDQRLQFLGRPLTLLQDALKRIDKLAPGGATPVIAVQRTTLAEGIVQNVQAVAAGAFTTLLVLYFVLIAGEQFLRRLVEILPNFNAKRQAVEIAAEIEGDISVYLATVTIMNAAFGCATAGVAWATGLGAPLLFGTLAFLLNYIPILGPTAGVVLFLVAGLVTIHPLWAAFMPALCYLVLHIVEGETLTPMLLAARFTVNPVLIALGVIFWFWMWGIVGAILATPMLAATKIVCDRIDPLKPIGHFIGGEPILFAGNRKAAP